MAEALIGFFIGFWFGAAVLYVSFKREIEGGLTTAGGKAYKTTEILP